MEQIIEKTTVADTVAPQTGSVVAVNISVKKGTKKHEVPSIELVEGLGIKDDAHAGAWHRQVSLLPTESVETMRALGLELENGAFAENILTEGLNLKELPVGTMLRVGDTLLVVTQIGKKCHNDCEIKKLTGKCVMPTDGIFTVVVRGGTVKAGDAVSVVDTSQL